MMKEETPRANRFHIGLFGRRNSGKSSLVNMLTGQQVAVVSDVPGTTTDVVLKNIELPGVGASVLVDTAGYDDEGELGGLRVRQTVNAARRVDLALIIVSGLPDGAEKEKAWAERFRADDIPVLYIYNKVDEDGGSHADAWRMTLGATEVVSVSARTGEGRDRLLSAMAEVYRRTDEVEELTGNLAGEGDTARHPGTQGTVNPATGADLAQLVGQTLYGFVLYGRPFVGHVVRLVVAPVPDYHGLASISYGGGPLPAANAADFFFRFVCPPEGGHPAIPARGGGVVRFASRCPRADSGGLHPRAAT